MSNTGRAPSGYAEESPFRLPAEMATIVYSARRVVTGDAVDFLPTGLTSGAVAKLVPAPPDGRERNVSGAAYSWCLFRLPDPGGGATTL